MKHKKSDIVWLLLGAAGILCFLAAVYEVNILHFWSSINSDTASDALLGQLIWQSGEVIPKTWYIAAETRIICTPNVAALFYGLTGNIALSMGLACFTMTLLITASAILLGRWMDFIWNQTVLFGLLILGIPCVPEILELLYLYVSYYAIHVVTLFFTLAVYGVLLKEEKVRRKSVWIALGVSLLLSLLLGMQGVRGLLVIYGPLFGMEVIRVGYQRFCKKSWKEIGLKVSTWVLGLLLLDFAGCMMPFSTGRELSRNFRHGFEKLFTVVLPNYWKSMGFEYAKLPGKVCLAVLFVLVAVELIRILVRMLHRENIKPLEWGYLVLCASPVVTALMVAFTTTQDSERYYFVLPFAMAYAVVLFCQNREKSIVLKGGVVAIAALLLGFNMLQIYLPVIQGSREPVGNAYEVVCYLEEKGVKTAIATFEKANRMTVLANGAIRVNPVDSMQNLGICKWMSSTDWYPPQVSGQEQTAYIWTESEAADFEAFLQDKGIQAPEITEIGDYYICILEANYSHLD